MAIKIAMFKGGSRIGNERIIFQMKQDSLKIIKLFENLKTFSGVMTTYTCKGKSLQVDLEEEGGWRL